ncbi:MAG TPA: LicD family protein [Rhabdochlamydiaceae bacterium]
MYKRLLLLILFFSSPCYSEEEEAFTVPFDFLMDVMKPLGGPVLISYHSIRENIFLNFRFPEAGLLESIGDFFFSPSQFLFAGKTVSHSRGDAPLQIVQSFDYDTGYFAKLFLSLLAFPVAEPIGVTFKGLAYLFPQTRKHHNAVKTLLHSPKVISHWEKYRQMGIKAFHSEAFIPCQGHKRPARLTKKQKIELEAFKEIITLLDAHRILYWVDCGTCLGAYRYGGIIPWDIDIDLAIFQDDHDNVKRLLSTLDSEKYQIQDWSSYSKPGTFLKLYIKETKNLIDIYHYKFDDAGNTISYFYSYEDSPFPDSWKKGERKCTKPLKFEQMFPLKRAEFDGLLVWAPQDAVAFLQSKYGENLEPSMLWDKAAKAFVKVADHPYWKD